MAKKQINLISVRLTDEAYTTLIGLLEEYPEEYKNISGVIRAGIFTLKRWRDKQNYEL